MKGRNHTADGDDGAAQGAFCVMALSWSESAFGCTKRLEAVQLANIRIENGCNSKVLRQACIKCYVSRSRASTRGPLLAASVYLLEFSRRENMQVIIINLIFRFELTNVLRMALAGL